MPIDISPGVSHGKSDSFRLGVILHTLHLVHSNENPFVRAGEILEWRMASAADCIGSASDTQQSNEELDLPNGGGLEDAVGVSPCSR